ncbi:class D sortase [Thermoactinomyces sp. CICC 10521]|uniref:class D sortase n=1 Tax=Thermoactinomyces sp. CICC 10521 TaxID=2767426 RepID=UPI001E388362|nr:class D sortase [Thermoactinomyces sp. CICC 10521]
MKWDRWLACLLVTLGSAYAGYSGIQYYEKIRAVQHVSADPAALAGDRKTADATQKAATDGGHDRVVVPYRERPKTGQHFADLIIPKLKAKMPVIEGTDEDELAVGVGHYAGSVLPGEPDNCVLSGHRDTVFRHVGELKQGDELQVVTSQGTFVYEITRTWVTDPDDRSVIVPLGRAVLTLTTCYPFSYIGPAPKRYIIQAQLKEKITIPQ